MKGKNNVDICAKKGYINPRSKALDLRIRRLFII